MPVGTERRGAQTRLRSYSKSADLNKGEAKSGGATIALHLEVMGSICF